MLTLNDSSYNRNGKSGFSLFANAWKNKRKLIRSKFTGKISPEIFEPHVYSKDDAFELIKPKDREFVILNFTDPHFADYDVRTLMAIPAARTMKRLVKDVKPDLITVTGDIVCSDSTHYSVHRFCALMESFGIPWAPVFGNHDNEGNCDLNYLADVFLSCPHCLFKKGDPEMGCGNYIVHISEEDTDGGRTVLQALIMMYHRDGYPSEKQLRWYRWATDGLRELSGGKAQAALMLHIPLPEYQYAYEELWDKEKKSWRPEADACGEIHEPVCCEKRDGVPFQRGLFDAVVSSGNTPNIICGHEHLNDFSVVYKGIRLTYALKVGKGSGAGFGLNGGTVMRVGGEGITRITHRAVHFSGITDEEDILIK